MQQNQITNAGAATTAQSTKYGSPLKDEIAAFAMTVEMEGCGVLEDAAWNTIRALGDSIGADEARGELATLKARFQNAIDARD